MTTMEAAETERDLRHLLAEAQHRPVTVAVTVADAEGRPVVILSMAEYDRLRRRDRQVFRTEDASEELIAAIFAAEPPAHTAAYDHEVP